MQNLNAAILEVVVYFSLFKYPPTSSEIRKYLKLEIGENDIKNQLQELVSTRKLSAESLRYALPGEEHIFKEFGHNEIFSKQLWDILNSQQRVFNKIPFLEFIGITGSLAHENCSSDSDIDLLIICEDQRLYIVRTLVVLYLRFKGLYRTKKNTFGKFCPNIWMEGTYLKFEDRGIYNAWEIYSIKKFIEKKLSLNDILSQNLQLRNYFGNISLEIKHIKKKQKVNIILNFINFLLYKIQLLKAGKNSNTYMTPKRAIFHPRPLSEVISTQYQKKLSEVLGI